MTMTAKERKEMQILRSGFVLGLPYAKIAKQLKVTEVGFPHRVVALLRKDCQSKYDE